MKTTIRKGLTGLLNIEPCSKYTGEIQLGKIETGFHHQALAVAQSEL